MPEKFSPEQWHKTEERVNEAEEATRKKQLAEVELRQEAGLTKKERNLSADEYLAEPNEVYQELEAEKEVLDAQLLDLLGPEDSPERSLINLRRDNLFTALRTARAQEIEHEKLLAKEATILQDMEQAQKAGKPVRGKAALLEKVRSNLLELKGKQTQLLSESPEAYFGLHLKDLKKYKQELKTGKIVEMPYVKGVAEDVTAHLGAQPVLIYGHLGSGKSELAMHVAKNILKDREDLEEKSALVISGSKHTSLAELYGHQVLALDKVDNNELDSLTKGIEAKFDAWATEYPDANENEKNRTHETILQVYLSQLKGGTISQFFLGPIYRAMKEGRPVILDEVNAIPHEVLISLNHILTRKVGEIIPVQQDSGETVEIKDGFGILMTGNLNQGQEKYIDREDMDPAFLSRLYKIGYDYLPQKIEGSLKDEAGPENELFQLILARMIDKNGNIEAPKDSIKKLWNLAKVAKITQNVFAGKEVNNAYYFQEAGGRPIRYLLKESVLSIRALDNILSKWQRDAYKYELDFYIWQEFISQGTVASDQAYLYQMFKDRFGFFQSAGWEQNPKYGSGGIVNAFDLTPPKNVARELEFSGPRDTVEFAFGKAPERTKWPEVEPESIEPENTNLEELAELEEFKAAFKNDLAKLGQEVASVCEIQATPEKQVVAAKGGFFSRTKRKK